LTLPVHLIRGGSSDLVSLEAVKHFQGLVPHMAYSDIANATHMVVGDANDAFGPSILELDRKSVVSGKSGSVGVELVRRRIIKKKSITHSNTKTHKAKTN